jgi:hypothetical protein
LGPFDGRATVNADLAGYTKVQTEVETRGPNIPDNSIASYFEGTGIFQ